MLKNNAIEAFINTIEKAYDRLFQLTGIDFLAYEQTDCQYVGLSNNIYFFNWLSKYGKYYLNTIRRANSSCNEPSFLDAMDEYTFTLEESLVACDASIIFATFADCVASVAKLLSSESCSTILRS